jgi:SAM-dependent methyltransferase
VQTLDPIAALPEGALSSPAAQRNAAAILVVLKAHLPARGRVLEIAAGSGEHALAFAAGLPDLEWIPSDPSPEARDSIAAWRRDGPANLRPALALDASDPATWPDGPFDVVYCANMTHISPWSATEGLMDLAGRVLRRPGGLLVFYGPYREAEIPLAASNAAFDESLKARNPAWGLRERETIEALARSHGLAATRRVQMPANNLTLLFRRA